MADVPCPPLGPSRRPRLFIDAQHGLCNRLRAIASAASIAQRTGHELIVIWRPDHHCACRISDLIDYTGPVIESAEAELFRAAAPVSYNYMEVEPGAWFQQPILPDAPRETARDGADV